MVKTKLELIKEYDDAFDKYAKLNLKDKNSKHREHDILQDLRDSEDYTNSVIAGEYLKNYDCPIWDFVYDYGFDKHPEDGHKEIFDLIVSALIAEDVLKLLKGSISTEYVPEITSAIIEDVISDVRETSALEDKYEYNIDDVKLAIGRVLSVMLGCHLMI